MQKIFQGFFERRRAALYLIYILLLLGAWGIFSYYFNLPIAWDFRNNLYLPTYLLAQNQSPYNIHVLVGGSNAVWFPMVIGLFSPFGHLSLQLANNLWWLLNFGGIFALVFISTGQSKPSIYKLPLLLLFFFLFPSTASHLNLGQVSILICLALSIIIIFDKKLPVWVIGFLFAFALTKPQLTIIIIPTYFYQKIISGNWKTVRLIIVWTLVYIVLLSIPVMLAHQHWEQDFILNLKNNPPWSHPSISTFLFTHLGAIGKVLGWIYIVASLGISLVLAKKKMSVEFGLWALALTTVISPYIWSWDFVLLYPLMTYIFFKQKDFLKHIFLFLGYLFIGGAFIIQKTLGYVNDFQNLWVPWAVLVLILIVSRLPKRCEHEHI